MGYFGELIEKRNLSRTVPAWIGLCANEDGETSTIGMYAAPKLCRMSVHRRHKDADVVETQPAHNVIRFEVTDGGGKTVYEFRRFTFPAIKVALEPAASA